MTDRKDKGFAAWFKEQYGLLPSERRREAALRKKRDAEEALRVAQIEYQMEDMRFAWFDTALKGWNARRK